MLTTGTGSGKSLAYIVPIVDQVLGPEQEGGKAPEPVKAIVVYPMNALANSQLEELEKFLDVGHRPGRRARHVRAATPARRTTRSGSEILANPPDILLTNYVMLELILTRPDERRAHRGRAGAAVPRPRRAAHLPRPAGRRRRRCSSAVSARPARPRSFSASAPRRPGRAGHASTSSGKRSLASATLLFGASRRPGERDRRDP